MFSQIYANTHGYPYALAEVKIYYLNTVNSESKWRRNQNTNNDFTHRQSPPQSVLLTHVNARTQPVQYMYIMTQESKNNKVTTNKKQNKKNSWKMFFAQGGASTHKQSYEVWASFFTTQNFPTFILPTHTRWFLANQYSNGIAARIAYFIVYNQTWETNQPRK